MDGLTMSELIWSSDYYVLDLKKDKEIIYEINMEQVEFSKKPSRLSKSLIDTTDIYKELVILKSKISSCKSWDKWVKLINVYDKVPNVAKSMNTRNYYNILEILRYSNIDNLSVNKSIHLGVSSASSLKAVKYFFPKVDWSIYQYKEPYPESKHGKIVEELESVKNENGYSRVNYLSEDYYFIDEINEIKEKDNDLIIVDPSIDTKHDPESQEQLTFYYIFLYITLALRIQKLDGCLIVKIYDSYTRPTCQLVSYLGNFYSEINIIKPRTSRSSSSEKYIIAKKYIGISVIELQSINNFAKNWDSNLYLRDLCIVISESIEKQYFEYNSKIAKNQYLCIGKIINCSYYEDVPEKQLEAFQNKKAIQFCNNFGIQINLSNTEIESVCKHTKRNKIKIGNLKNSYICEKCFSLIMCKS